MHENVKIPAITPTGLLVICILIFMACWVKFLFPTWLEYVVDYVERVTVIVLIVAYGGFRFRATTSFFRSDAIGLSALVLLLSVGLYHVEQSTWISIPLLGDTVHQYSVIQYEPHIYFDLTVGLMLVAVSEELVSRYLVVKIFSSNVRLQYIVTFLSFGLIHLPQGLYGMMFAGVFGLFFMWLYKRTRTLAAPVIVHYLFNLYFFSTVYYGHIIGTPI